MKNILAIASVLPIPGLRKENNVILRLYQQIQQDNPGVRVSLWLPLAWPFPYLSLFKGSAAGFMKLHRQGSYQTGGLTVNLLKGIRFRAPRPLYSLVLLQAWLFYRLNKSALISCIREEGITVIHAHYGFFDGYIAWRLSRETGIPYVVTLRKEREYFRHLHYKRYMKKILAEAQAVTTPSAYMKEFLAALGDYPVVHAIPHGIEPEFIQESAENREALNPSLCRILTVSRLLDWKRVDVIIEALKDLEGSWHYTLIGQGPQKRKIKAMIKRYALEDRVTLVDGVEYSQMKSVYSRHDLFVLPSYPETFGRVYFEAMAAGLPVICADKLSINGFFTPGKEGFAVDPQDPEALSARLKELISDSKKREAMGRAAQELVKGYTWANVGSQYFNLL